jgi:CubicO group peptidase (beta-lactamase class C family)
MNYEAQKHIQKLLDESVEKGADRGLQITAYLNGKVVVDAFAGVADVRSGLLVNSETLFPVFSVTKGMVATVIHQLVDQGKLFYDQPIADIWPEFGVNGKKNITLKQAMNHTAGLQNVPLEIGVNEACDWKKICGAIARSAPANEPGNLVVYHAMTYGWILGEIASIVIGKPFGQIVQENINQPIGIKDLYVGIPDEVEDRVAFLEDVLGEFVSQENLSSLTVPLWMWPLHDRLNRGDIRRACIPGSNGIMSAHAVARHYAALLPVGVEGKRLLSIERIKIATDTKVGVYDDNKSTANFWTLGYYLLDGPAAKEKKKLSPFGHGGFGGSMGFADPSCGLAVGFTKNLFNNNGLGNNLIIELRKALGVIVSGLTNG